MKALENRTLDSKVEMDIIEALDEIKALNSRNERIDADTLLEQHKKLFEEKEGEFLDEDEKMLQNVVFKNSTSFVKRLEEDSSISKSNPKQNIKTEPGVEERPTKRIKENGDSTTPAPTPSVPASSISFLPIPKKKEEKKVEVKTKVLPQMFQPKVTVNNSSEKTKPNKEPPKKDSSTSNSLLGNLVDYGDDSD